VSDPASSSTSSLRRDVISAYAATAAKIGSWVIVLGMIYRYRGEPEFAVLALIRGTIGILNYTTLGLSPAMIRLAAEARTPATAANEPLSYYSAEPERNVQALYANGLMIALLSGVLGLVVSAAYALGFPHFYHLPHRVFETFWPVLLISV